jgi:hypothetical protein
MMSNCCGTYPYNQPYQYPYFGGGYSQPFGGGYSQPYTFASPYQYAGLSYGMPYGYPQMYDWGCNYYGLPFGYAYGAPGFGAGAFPGHARGEYKVGNCLMICQ